jgi:aromatic-L-amino-acid decarboxylase
MVSEWNEETLDPENWDELRALGHRMLDDMINHQRDIAEKKQVFATENAIKNICIPLPENGEGEQSVYEVFRNSIQPHLSGNAHPRFWGAVGGTGSPYGMLASMLAAGANSPVEEIPSVFGYTHRQVIEWIIDLLGYPKDGGGVLVSGGSEANYTALAVARNARAEVDMKAKGMQGVPRRMTVYVSDGGHHCLERSVELLGIGGENLRWIETGDDFRIKIDSLKKEIERDRDAGYYPFCVIGCAGTVDTGAFDDLNALADLAERENLWLHIDGAFGGWVKISKTHRHLADGLERADSVAVDLHKWMYMPYGIGCTLVRDRLAHYKTFVYGHEAQYVKASRGSLKISMRG